MTKKEKSVLVSIILSAVLAANGLLLPGRTDIAQAQSASNSVSADANGLSVSVTATVAGVPASVSLPSVAEVTLPPGGGSKTNQAASASVGIQNVLPVSTTGVISDSVAGSINQTTAQANATSIVNGLNVVTGLVGATIVRSDAASTSNGSLATSNGVGSFVEGLKIGGIAYDQTQFPPNTQIAVTGNTSATVAGVPVNVPLTGTVTINEQSTSGDGAKTSSIQVNGIHVSLSGSATGAITVSIDVVVASASSGVSFTASTPPPPGDNPPTLNVPGPQTVQAGSTLSFPVTGSDPDAGDSVTITATGLPPNSAFTPNPATGNPASGQFTFTPAEAQAGQTVAVNFTATDSHGASTGASVDITITPSGSGSPGTTVNHPPVISVPGDQIIGVGKKLEFVVAGSDPDGDSVTMSATGVPAGATFVAGTGDFTFVPTADQSGQVFAVTFKATDSQGASATAPVMITVVSSSNPDTPIISVPISPISIPVGVPYGFVVTATSPNGCAAPITASNVPANASFDSSANKFSFTPTAEQQGKTFTVTFSATDCQGKTGTVMVTIIVVSANPGSGGTGRACVPATKLAFEPSAPGGCCGSIAFTVTNVGSGPLTINSASLADGSNFSVYGASGFPIVLAPGGTIQLNIAFMPKQSGQAQDTLTISTSDQTQPSIQVDLKGKGRQ